MKKTALLLVLLLSTIQLFSQTNTEISNVYLKKASQNYKDLETSLALVNFNKAIALLDTITDPKTARLGVLIQYELQNFKEAANYSKLYFLLVKNDRSEDYQKQLELYVEIRDEIDKIQVEEKKLEKERLAKEKETQRIDSLTLVWKNQIEDIAVKADIIYAFDKNNLALFKRGNNFGIVNDTGVVLVNADEYKAAYHFDGYFILMNNSLNPNKIYCFNGVTKRGYKLPDASEFNPLATHYGQVMLPRGSNKLIAYPNNSLKILEFDLLLQKFISTDDEKSLFKDLDKKKAISGFNNDGEVKVSKEWYHFGGILGGGIFSLFNTNYTIFGFISGIDGRVLDSSTYNYIGSFYNEKLQVLTNNETFWINQIGTKVEAPKDESGEYNGTSKTEKTELGNYLFYNTSEGGEKTIISGDKKFLNLSDFIKSKEN